ncbi:MAG: hypothetical protein IT454_19160 [Planctomycetes bacterium]|nr:hypothetical protein [Planctomycetota bacterium]
MSPLHDLQFGKRAHTRKVEAKPPQPATFDGLYTLQRRAQIGAWHGVEVRVDFKGALLESAQLMVAADARVQGNVHVEFDGQDVVLRLRGVR